MLKPHMPAVDDAEGAAVPGGLPPVVDAHVHIFPPAIAAALWKWFDANAYPIRYQFGARATIDYLLSRGIARLVLLQYAHKPGMARLLNRFMADTCARYPGRVTGLATVFPGEADAAAILQEAFDAGLGGLKLHAHVQCFDMTADVMHGLYACCRSNGKPVIIHAGREPRSAAYQCDPYTLCSAERLAAVVREYPAVKFCVPHLGMDETAAYRRLIERHDNLWLDTAMALSAYLRGEGDIDLNRYRPDRIMYGSDFPNIPFAWDRELKKLAAATLDGERRERILHANATDFLDLPPLREAAVR